MTNSSKIDLNVADVTGGGVALALNGQCGLGMGGGQIKDNTAASGTQLSIQHFLEPASGSCRIKYGAAYFVPNGPPDLSFGTSINPEPSSEWFYDHNFAITENGTRLILDN
ncbi:MAG: hypothetical protein LBD20_08885 [Spirochaetaceae bacterium]|jgi:hypothetical protein|nr:hypothetical protein [Spirochaetaceae bacterium]